MRAELFAAAIVFTAAMPLSSKADTTRVIHMIMVGGASNAAGKGELSEWPSNLPRFPDNLWTFRQDNGGGSVPDGANKWQHPVTPNYRGRFVGPALPMADQLVRLRPGYDVGLVPCAQGGSSIIDWYDDREAPDSLFERCLNQVRLAEENCPQGYRCQLDEIFWWQGEPESTATGDHANWLSKTKSLFDQFRLAFDSPELPILYVRLGLFTPKVVDGTPYWDFMRQQMTRLQYEFPDGKVKMLDIDFVPYPEAGDWHMTTPKYITIGTRAGTILDRML